MGLDYRARLVERLRALLDSAGVSVSALEKRLDHGRGYVGDALRGDKRLSVETILEVLEAVGVAPEDFFEQPTRSQGRASEATAKAVEARLRFPANAAPLARVLALLLADEALGRDDLQEVQREVTAALRRKRAAD